MSVNASALEALKRRRTRIAWLKVWYLGLRRDLFRAKKAAANIGWWGDLQDRWADEEWRLERTSNRTREELETRHQLVRSTHPRRRLSK